VLHSCGERIAQRHGCERDTAVRAPGDRRSRIRFEVFGAFWGTFDAGDCVRVHNLTRHGVLVEAGQPLAIESIQRVCLILEGQPTLADAQVRHLRATTTARGARYLIGMEFLTSSVSFAEAVDRLVLERTAPNTEPA
jgi:hypothetical protein